MEEHTKEALDDILSRSQAFPEAEDMLEQILSVVILPVLREFAEEIRSGGHEAVVSGEKGAELVVHPHGRKAGTLCFTPRYGKIAISVDGSPRGSVPFETIDPVLIEEHVLAFLSSVF
ncbi:MAG: hypothetical protein KAT70_07515 [Thermoplasmata archaeon]|nr:hypothetical protein [Thermoplasmata archaeon]